jgi:cell division control protein 6
MDNYDLNKIIKQVRIESQSFKNKSKLASLSNDIPTNLVGRRKQTTSLVRYLMSFENEMIVPLVSVFGRSGSGKSSVVKFVCENMPDVDYCSCNLRKAKTLFGCVNLILGELGHEPIKNSSGMNKAMETIKESVRDRYFDSSKKLFVLVLDEFDVIFYDRRGNPSNFVYGLIEMQSDLAEENIPMTIVTISNNVIGDYEFDDRVRSRIGSSEIFFRPLRKEEILEILKDRAKEACAYEIHISVLEDIADICSNESGDIRRAIEILRVAIELATSKNRQVSKIFVNYAASRLDTDRLEQSIKSLSHNAGLVCFALGLLTVETKIEWHSTMHIFERFRKLLSPGSTLITYRRVSELLVDLHNTGILSSSTTSEGRNGYSSKYRLNMDPNQIGEFVDKERWKKERDRFENDKKGEEILKLVSSRKGLTW